MTYDTISDKLIDNYDGQVDLKIKIIRCVGNPDDRFKEVYLRIIRVSIKIEFNIGEVKDMNISGKDIMKKLNIKSSPRVGMMLNK